MNTDTILSNIQDCLSAEEKVLASDSKSRKNLVMCLVSDENRWSALFMVTYWIGETAQCESFRNLNEAVNFYAEQA